MLPPLGPAPPSFKFNFYSQYFGLSFNFMFHSQYFGTSFKFQYISATRFHIYINDLPRQKPPDQVARWYWPGIKVSTIFHCIVWLCNHVRLSTVDDIGLAMEFQRYFDVLCESHNVWLCNCFLVDYQLWLIVAWQPSLNNILLYCVTL